MENRVITRYDEFLKLREPWAELHRVANGSLFQLHEWLALWWKHYGANRDLSVLTFWNDALLVGVVPGFTETMRLGPISMRRMSMLGEEEIYGEYFPLVEPGSVENVARSSAGYWVEELERGSIDVLDFHGFPPDSEFMEAMIRYLRAGARVRFVQRNLSHTTIEGATNGEEFLKLMSKHRRQSLRRDERALQKDGMEVEVVRQWDGGKHFDDLVRLHQSRWEKAGEPGRFGSTRFLAFVREITQELMTSGMARIYFARIGDERVAATLSMVVNRKNYPYVVGRNPVHESMRYSVGEVLSMRGYMDAFDEGDVLTDLLGGDYQYKHYREMTRRWYARATAIGRGMQGAKGAMYWGALELRDTLKHARQIFKRPAIDNRREASLT